MPGGGKCHYFKCLFVFLENSRMLFWILYLAQLLWSLQYVNEIIFRSIEILTCKLAYFDAFNMPLLSGQVFNPAKEEVALSWIILFKTIQVLLTIIYFLVLIQQRIDHMAKTTGGVNIPRSKIEINKLCEFDVSIHIVNRSFYFWNFL